MLMQSYLPLLEAIKKFLSTVLPELDHIILHFGINSIYDFFFVLTSKTLLRKSLSVKQEDSTGHSTGSE